MRYTSALPSEAYPVRDEEGSTARLVDHFIAVPLQQPSGILVYCSRIKPRRATLSINEVPPSMHPKTFLPFRTLSRLHTRRLRPRAGLRLKYFGQIDL